jgi:hypothetical protein
MIKRLVSGVWTIFVYACVATIISQAIMLSYLISTWKIDQQRWLQVYMAARGIESVKNQEPAAKTGDETPSEQPSYEQILEARAMKYRNLELREQQLRDAVSQLQFQEAGLADNEKSFQKLREGFNAQLSSMRDGSLATGKEEVRRTLESIKPKQAKQLILEMLENKEINDVVALLTPMSDAKRAKIIGEFKTPEELEKISEVLRLIREGQPQAKVTETTLKKLEETNSPQL